VLVCKLLGHGVAEDRVYCHSEIDEDVVEKAWVTECYNWRTLFLVDVISIVTEVHPLLNLAVCQDARSSEICTYKKIASRSAEYMVICK
jgi:hypothetical protein